MVVLPQIPAGIDPITSAFLSALRASVAQLQDETKAALDKINGNTTEDMTCILQMVQNHVITIFDYVPPAARTSAVVMDCFTTSITTKKANSRIAYDGFISGEIQTNSCIFLERVVDGVATEIGSPVAVGSHAYGIINPVYDPDNNSTMNQNTIQYIDSPGVATGTVITYRLKIYSGDGYTAHINHTVADTDHYAYERATSNIRLTELI